MRYRHLILDRDGVLNYEAPSAGYVMEPEGFRWIPGALEGLAMLRRAGIRLSVATNQSGVGRGLMTVEQLEAVHARMLADAAAAGGALDAVLVCPHTPEAGCACRKPAPGLIETAVAQSGILARETLVVGDDVRDLQAAALAQVAAVLVRTGKGRETEARMGRPASRNAADARPEARARPAAAAVSEAPSARGALAARGARVPVVPVFDDLAALARAVVADAVPGSEID